MFDNTVFLTIGGDKYMVKILKYCLKSILHYETNFNYDIVIYCDSHVLDCVLFIIEDFKTFNIQIRCDMGGKWSSFEDISSKCYFGASMLSKSKKILYLDIDILVTTKLSTYFDQELLPNTLYVTRERIDFEDHKTEAFMPIGLEYTQEHIDTFIKNGAYPLNSGVFMFENSERMRYHFFQVNKLRETYPNALDQQLTNFYFGQKNLLNFTLFTDKKVILIPNSNQMHEDAIIHFMGKRILPKHVIMKNYYKRFIEKKRYYE